MLVAAAVVGAGAFATVRYWPDQQVLDAGPTAVSSGAGPSGSATAASPTGVQPSGRALASAGAERAETLLTECRRHVSAGDEVIDAAETGIGHWNEHVQAQTDAYAGKLDADQLAAIFSRTRLLGPADLTRYNEAVARYQDAGGSCAAATGATRSVAAALTTCRRRDQAQTAVLAAARDAMTDWADHQADMRKSRHEHVPDAQRVWITTWRAAPPHLDAWKNAAKDYDPPAC